jgi:tetratricopeptide (TPR) repeat protein
MRNASLLDESGRETLRRASAALDAAEERCQPFEMSQALVQVARAYASLRALTGAEIYLEQALRWARTAGSTDHVVDILSELAECAAGMAEAPTAQAAGARAARERARDHAFEASTMAGRVADPDWEVTVLLRLSDVLDRCGDRDDATLLQSRALRLMAGSLAAPASEAALQPSLGRLADA